MTATTIHTDGPRTVLSTGTGLRPGRILAAEWLKVVSLRSTWWFTAAIVLAVAGLGTFMAIGVAVGAADGAEAGPLGGALSGISIGELIVAAFAVLAVTGEYSSGAIHTTFTAVPRRRTVVAAKAAVASGFVLALSLALTFATFGVATVLMGTAGVDLSLSAPGVVRALVGGGLYLTVIAAMGVGLGWMLRSTAGAIGAVFGILYGLPLIGLFLPEAVAADVTRYLPSNAGAAIIQALPAEGMLAPWTGLAVMAAWALATLIGAVVVVRRRDA